MGVASCLCTNGLRIPLRGIRRLRLIMPEQIHSDADYKVEAFPISLVINQIIIIIAFSNIYLFTTHRCYEWCLPARKPRLTKLAALLLRCGLKLVRVCGARAFNVSHEF